MRNQKPVPVCVILVRNKTVPVEELNLNIGIHVIRITIKDWISFHQSGELRINLRRRVSEDFRREHRDVDSSVAFAGEICGAAFELGVSQQKVLNEKIVILRGNFIVGVISLR